MTLKWSICVFLRGSEFDSSHSRAVLHKGDENNFPFVYLVRFKPTVLLIFAVIT